MRELVVTVLMGVVTSTLLASTGWLASTAVKLSENSVQQTVLLQGVTNQVSALVLDVAQLESGQSRLREFSLLHPTAPHSDVTAEINRALAPVLREIEEIKDTYE